MFIKRSAFLLLTGVLAQQACTTVNNNEAPGDGGDSGTGAKAGSPSNAGSPDEGGASANGAGSDAGGTGGAGVGGDDGLGGGDDGLGGGAAGDGAGGGAEGGAGSCDDSVGTPASCDDICTDGAWCDSFATNLKPRVAELAVACLAEGTKCDDFTYECVKTALGGACPVPENDVFCADAVTACNPSETIDLAGCHALVDGLNEAGIAQIYSCVEDGCVNGLWSCVESVQ